MEYPGNPVESRAGYVDTLVPSGNHGDAATCVRPNLLTRNFSQALFEILFSLRCFQPLCPCIRWNRLFAENVV